MTIGAWPRGLLLVLLLVLAGCAGKTEAQGVSGRNPDLAHLGPFDSTVVLVGKLSEEEREEVEGKLIDALRDIGVKVVPGSDIAGRDAAAQEAVFRAKIGTRQPDTVLVIQRDSATERKQYIPPQHNPGYSYPIIVGGFTSWVHVPPSVTPGRWVTEEEGLYLAVLLHRPSGKSIWAAAIGSKGDVRADWTAVTNEAVKEIVDLLIKDGAFEPAIG